MESIVDNSIGLRLREERRRLGLSQEEFGALGGEKFVRQTVSYWEKDELSPPSTFLVNAADAGLDVLYVITGRRDPGQTAGPSAIDALTPDEQALLTYLKRMNKADKAALLRMAKGLAGAN
jgi:transcriptional regulator with XRE-family HTH domain